MKTYLISEDKRIVHFVEEFDGANKIELLPTFVLALYLTKQRKHVDFSEVLQLYGLVRYCRTECSENNIYIIYNIFKLYVSLLIIKL